MSTIFDELRKSHDLARKYTRTMTSTRSSPSKRKESFLALAIELQAHAAAEERFLYAPCIMHDAGLSESRHALSEHHEHEEMIEKIRSLDPKGKAFIKHAKELSEKIHHHFKDEEKGFFQLSGRILSETQKTKLNKEYIKDYDRMKKKLSNS